MSKRIDHAFINEHWASLFLSAFSEFLEPGQSDHAPCFFLVPIPQRAAIKPFKFFCHVTLLPDFSDVIANEWAASSVMSSCQFKLVRALKLMKPVLRRLNKLHFSGISIRVKQKAEEVADLRSRILTSPSVELAREENIASANWSLLLSAEERFFMQKSRIQWLDLGDKNTSYFHKMVLQRNSQNYIHFFRAEDGSKITDSLDLKSHAVDYFKSIFGSTNMPSSPVDLVFLQGLLPFRCSDSHAQGLLREVSAAEIKEILYAMPSNKSPGPDGYPAEFFKSAWSTVGPDLIGAIQEIFRNGRLLKDLNATVIALIPKTPEASSLADFRPISCCNLAYKIISKILANRLKPLLLECISPNQAAFLSGRSLGENVLLALELIRNYDKSSCLKSSLLKIDIRKAFDTVCWDFVLKILEAQNFPPLFRSWIKECMTSPRFSISINGELAGFFEGKKGLRQGDSISPYLFIMVMEVLSRLLDVGAVEGKFSAHPLCTSPPLTHLAFADDLLVFSDGSQHSLLGIMGILSQFHSLSGLDMNPAKSELFFGGLSVSEAAQISGVVGVKLGTFPSRYLGLPLNPTKLSLSTLQPFLQKITSQLHSWTSKFLSYAGRIRLIVSVIYVKVNFWSQVFVLPKGFYKRVDSLCAAFL